MSVTSSQGSRDISPELRELASRNSHLQSHLAEFKRITGKFPMLVEEPDDEHEVRYPNILYQTGDVLFTHVYGAQGQDTKYYAVEPTLNEDEADIYDKTRRAIIDESVNLPAPTEDSEFDEKIETLLDRNTVIKDEVTEESLWERIVRILKRIIGEERIELTKEAYRKIRYRLNRDIIGLGPLEPIMRDPHNEDIHVVAPDEVFVEHDIFGLTGTTVDFGTDDEYDQYLRSMAERIGKPVSDSNPIIDATMPDGSRLNLIYSDDVSIRGPSMTLRQQEETPLTIAQITKWGTFSPMAAAYMWMALENDMSAFVVGETASGKTTTLNAITSFIPPGSKIYTAEDTAEVVPPHDAWQQLLTRESGGDEEEAGDVSMFNLVEAALRSRPDYIIVGEVRGEEGRMAFQAMQTGHPVMLTFHAGDIKSLIQRFTSSPIEVPETFFGTLNIAIFQNFVLRKGEGIRRVTSIHEIEGYSDELDGIVTREVFTWDPVDDEIIFKGMNNSYILEDKIAEKKSYEDTRRIYDDLELRRRIMEKMIQEGILGYNEVNETINTFQRDGVEGLPFEVEKPEGAGM
ncbi:MAG: type II/IV secretion system ATPase subunit [Halobacteria archaeon]|nr:type II/IV secretion system ATPase subunit [Halobacteria archaeon]